ncbi:sucrose-6-phosphate hydrolase [uncultured Ligilactobacillus sp.]|uniref:sucrose-6-phosphate hydrolase n=1 Tax=uncultured Ligilactobacillus sp. TaxID=2837633 RepID=UPI00272D9BE7|nr:sucrose-6-phosphate hydrolase [uncultured Ligilactobacillus sp.]
MEWTREMRYRAYADWSAETLLKLQAQAANSPYQMSYHIRPSSGLLNDPNGFSYFNGQWHVFYQSFPFGAAHGLKSWMHLVSDDLVHWKDLGLAIAPDTKYDSHGAYSGSALPVDDKLFLMYTGNHRDQDWIRHPFQLGAWMDQEGQITKLTEPLITQPDHTTDHFRDPQVFKHRDLYYVVLGAQDKETKTGKISLFSSKDLKEFTDLGYLEFTAEEMGYMIECPNLIFVDDKPLLVFCPQGLDKDVVAYDNIYPNMYLLGEDVQLNKARFEAGTNQIQNLDDGFDVYASQAFNTPDGKAYLISWVGLPDVSYPTDEENWASCLSQVKELSLKDGKLIQRPVVSMAALREKGTPLQAAKKVNAKQQIIAESGEQYELKLTLDTDQNGTLHLAGNDDLSQSLKLEFSTGKDAYLTVSRADIGAQFATEFGTTRTIALPDQKALDLEIFIDHSLCEIFVNGGEHVLTLRFFAETGNKQIALTSPTEAALNYRGTFWKLKSI